MTKNVEKNLPDPISGNIADRIATLSPTKQALFQMRLEKKGAITLPIPKREDRAPAPLSFSQQRLWILNRWEPDNTMYNVSLAFELTGPCDSRALAESLNEIVRRHEALRTNFEAHDGYPIQRVAPQLALDISVINLKDIPMRERRNRIKRLTGDEARRPFDLAGETLIRASLFRLDEEAHVLLVVMHHIVTDGWSMGVFFRELSILYSSFSQGKPSPLPDLSIQYGDFAVWQRQRLQGELLESELEYWKTQLNGVRNLELPTDRSRPPVQTFHGARKDFMLTQSLTEALLTLSRREGVTLFMTFLATFQLLLHRLSGQDDITVGTPIANRNREEIEGLIGFFVNTLVLRTDLGGNPTFYELLGRVRETALGAYANQDLPFEKLVEEMNPERSPSHSPLFQVMLVLQNAPGENLKLPGLAVESSAVETGTAKFDLTLFLTETAEGVRGIWEYNTDLFDGSTIERMSGCFRELLEGIVAGPEMRISVLALLTEVERHRLLVEWNDTKVDYPGDKCIHELFEQQAERTPDAVALVFEDQQLTYGELNTRSNQLAHYLRKRGVGPDVLVGICVERSLEMMVGLLGILKAGGAYLPLDRGYPVERLAFMLEDAKVPVLLTKKHLLALLPHTEAEPVCLENDWPIIVRESKLSPASESIPENLAYVIFTSGSTGRPKGIAMSHGSLCNLISWQSRRSNPAILKTVQFSPLSFDVSFQEIFATLCAGGILILLPEELRRDSCELLMYLREKSIGRLFIPFVALQQLADAASRQEAELPELREVIVAGEQLQITSSITAWFAKLPQCILENQYGPSESHVVSAFKLNGPARGWPLLPPIGRPIDNVRLFILDCNLQLVPVGVPGELCIGGVQVARGYLNRPELTAEKFVPDPFANDQVARLYKSGDLARYLPDGNIEFLGRIDHQVKIRGFRIEPGEIEAVLVQHPGVREAVVMVREDMVGDKRLIAYVVPEVESPPNTGELRCFLAEKLPDYMVPSSFVTLDALPLTPSGKVDRHTLPVPDHARPELEEPYIAPRTSVEQALAEIWGELLALERVGVHDNFFELGGHSLLATQLISRIDKAFAIYIPLHFFFKTPTLSALSSFIEGVIWHRDGRESCQGTSGIFEEGEI